MASSPLITVAHYPRYALQKGLEGRTVAEIVIGDDGRVTQCKTATSSGYGLLDDRTCAVLKERKRYDPVPTKRVARVPVRWKADFAAPNPLHMLGQFGPQYPALRLGEAPAAGVIERLFPGGCFKSNGDRRQCNIKPQPADDWLIPGGVESAILTLADGRFLAVSAGLNPKTMNANLAALRERLGEPCVQEDVAVVWVNGKTIVALLYHELMVIHRDIADRELVELCPSLSD